MAKPENLPLDLVSIRNEIIDVAYGRAEKVSNDIENLYEWLKCDGWDELVALVNLDYAALDIKGLAESYFDDRGLDTPIKDIDDSIRIKYAREKIESVISTYEYEVKSILPLYLENEDKEGAFIYAYTECRGQGGIEVIHWGGIFKDFAGVEQDIGKSDQFKLFDDCGKLTDQEILDLWHYKDKKSNNGKTPHKYVCPNCKMKAGVNIVYGMPSVEFAEKAERGEIKLGDCVIEDGQFERYCFNCEHEWRIVRRTKQ